MVNDRVIFQAQFQQHRAFLVWRVERSLAHARRPADVEYAPESSYSRCSCDRVNLSKDRVFPQLQVGYRAGEASSFVYNVESFSINLMNSLLLFSFALG